MNSTHCSDGLFYYTFIHCISVSNFLKNFLLRSRNLSSLLSHTFWGVGGAILRHISKSHNFCSKAILWNWLLLLRRSTNITSIIFTDEATISSLGLERRLCWFHPNACSSNNFLFHHLLRIPTSLAFFDHLPRLNNFVVFIGHISRVRKFTYFASPFELFHLFGLWHLLAAPEFWLIVVNLRMSRV